MRKAELSEFGIRKVEGGSGNAEVGMGKGEVGMRNSECGRGKWEAKGIAQRRKSSVSLLRLLS